MGLGDIGLGGGRIREGGIKLDCRVWFYDGFWCYTVLEKLSIEKLKLTTVFLFISKFTQKCSLLISKF